ncbi:MAG TPA: YeeE/YedE thiosulfate transporter family protein [Pirellulaceae bacterium]|nr:YeeE/YedE thiosulfate transporter family protein [Pirellulaceae bacterium]HMO90569.1 YeeE/YedE thiosulfate transporter family protein [Pirellulaceae bacterium]HMP71233.1 YeeE/YedE thiosulfate transporter family protein [Pirellulaceae bacterium]
MMEFLLAPWPWWFSGILVGLTVPLLFILSGKAFGISTSLQQAGAMCAPGCKASYLRDHDRREHAWTLVFVLGIGLGGYVAAHWLSATPVEFLPESYLNVAGLVKLLVGGFLIGFGARYAGGCTSGHSITGIANLSWPSLVATIAFFAGGLGVTWGLGTWLFS